ncbi:MAG: monovalent cation/H(+) antiporter subunit G [Alphaproteobacteria bacterium]|nr:monovalent cation/H(+) antiporter subunit G [Alphaproteobacteria bacterium]
MSQIVIDGVSWALLIAGSILVLVGALGLMRMPDFYTRMHAAGITDTLGADLILLGLMVQAGFTLVTVKLLLIGAFLFFTSPTSTHAIANAAYTAGLRPSISEWDTDEPPEGPERDHGEEDPRP